MSYLDTLTVASTSQICQYHSGLLAYRRPHSRNQEADRRIQNGSRWMAVTDDTKKIYSVTKPNEGQSPSKENAEIRSRQVSQLDLYNSPESISAENRASNSVSAKAHLLSMAGMFDSGRSDGSVILKKVVAEALEKKYGGKTDGKPD